jgi:hypothetical protein
MTQSTKPTIRIHNVETDEVIEREMNDAEFAQYEKDRNEWAAERADKLAKENARQEILDRLGITADEAAILLG